MGLINPPQLSGADFECSSPSIRDINVHVLQGGMRLGCSAAGPPDVTVKWVLPSGKAVEFKGRKKKEREKNFGSKHKLKNVFLDKVKKELNTKENTKKERSLKKKKWIKTKTKDLEKKEEEVVAILNVIWSPGVSRKKMKMHQVMEEFIKNKSNSKSRFSVKNSKIWKDRTLFEVKYSNKTKKMAKNSNEIHQKADKQANLSGKTFQKGFYAFRSFILVE